MKRCSLWVTLTLLFCVVITIVSAPPSSLAYITAGSNIVHNTFRVEYLPPQDINVPIKIKKSMINLSDEEIGPGGFEFYLINEDTGEATVATSAEDGWAEMNLTFTAEDLDKTYKYKLYELNTGRENVTFDETVYNISIALVLDEMHEMTAELTMDGAPVTEIIAEYVNEYYVPTPLPDTGDQAQPLLWLAMLILSGTGLVMLKRKRTIFRRL